MDIVNYILTAVICSCEGGLDAHAKTERGNILSSTNLSPSGSRVVGNPYLMGLRNVISVRISERELLGLSVRLHVWLLFEPSDERACPLKRQVEIIDTEEQTTVSHYPATEHMVWKSRTDLARSSGLRSKKNSSRKRRVFS